MSRRIASESEKNNLYDATKRARNFLGPMFEIPKFFLIPKFRNFFFRAESGTINGPRLGRPQRGGHA